MTTIAAIVPVPDLSRFGYGRIAGECIASMARVFDTVYLVSSSRNDDAARAVAGKHDNAMLISDERTWFARTPDGAEWFDAYRVMENANIGLAMARQGMHAKAVCLMCNWYVPNWSDVADYIRRYSVGQAWTWLYRMDQLGDTFFHASTRLPYIVNLHGPGDVRFSTDSLVVGDQIIRMERGAFDVEVNTVSVVDAQLEVTRDELRDKLNYIRCYHDLVPKRKALFEWPYWFTYYTEKYRAKRMAFAQQNAVSALSQEDFVSQMVLRAL